MTKKTSPNASFDEIQAISGKVGDRFSIDERLDRIAESQKETDRMIKETGKLVRGTSEQMKKTDERLDKLFKETDERIDKLFKETDGRIDKLFKETDGRIDKLCKQMGGINDNIGHHAEQFFQDVLKETLTFGGEKYDDMHPNLKYSSPKGGVEIDIMLINGKSVALIEAKNRIHPNFIEELAVEKIAEFRKFFPLYKNHKVYLGIAGFSFSKAVLEKAKMYGVGVIRQVGKAVEIEAEHLKAY
jgi:hypothetical protein